MMDARMGFTIVICECDLQGWAKLYYGARVKCALLLVTKKREFVAKHFTSLGRAPSGLIFRNTLLYV